MPPSFAWRAPIVLSAAAALSLAACEIEDSSTMSSGACPSDETCSQEGVALSGSAFTDGDDPALGVATVAVGGKETILASQASDTPAFLSGFSVTSEAPATIAVGSVRPPSFAVQGRGAGTSPLKVFALDGSGLLGEVDVAADTIASVAMFPRELTLDRDVVDFGPASPNLPAALLAGGTAAVPLIVRLLGNGGERLADETLEVDSALGPSVSGPYNTPAWDLFWAAVPASAGQLSFSAQAGGGSFDASLPVVDTIESIVLVSDPEIGTIAGIPLCFLATSGGAAVAGADWTFSPSSNVVVLSTLGSWHPSCLYLQGLTPGTATLSVTASGVAETFTFKVVSGMP